MKLAVQLIAYGCTFLSMYLYPRRILWGPVIGAAAFIPWSILALQAGTPSLVLFSAAVAVMHGRAFAIWRSNGRSPHESPPGIRREATGVGP